MANEKPSRAAAGRSPAQFVRSWLRLVRIEHALISAFGVLVGIMVASRVQMSLFLSSQYPPVAQPGLVFSTPLPEWPVLLAALSVPVLVNVGAFALNDLWDIEADKKNRQLKRPLVSGEISPSVALWTGIFGLLIGALAGFLVGFEAGLIALFFALLSLAYNYKLKDWPLAGNITIALSMAIAFLFGSVAAGQALSFTSFTIWILCIGAFFAGLGREIVKTVQDMEGDKKARNSKSLPHVIGARASLVLAALCFVLYMLTVPLLVIFSPALDWNALSLGLLALSLMAFAAMAWKIAQAKCGPDSLEQARKSSLYALVLALLGILLACL